MVQDSTSLAASRTKVALAALIVAVHRCSLFTGHLGELLLVVLAGGEGRLVCTVGAVHLPVTHVAAEDALARPEPANR